MLHNHNQTHHCRWDSNPQNLQARGRRPTPYSVRPLGSAYIYIYHHSVVCLTTGPKPLPKRALQTVRSRASSFKWEYPVLSLRSSNSFLRLPPCLPVTSIPPCIFPSVTRCRRQFIYIYAHRQYSTLKCSILSQTNSSNCSTKTEHIHLTGAWHYLCNIQRNFWKKYVNNQQIHCNIYDVFYSQCSHQHVLVGITAICRVILLQRYKHTDVGTCVTITLKMAVIPVETCWWEFCE
jgi:hypothetical protein